MVTATVISTVETKDTKMKIRWRQPCQSLSFKVQYNVILYLLFLPGLMKIMKPFLSLHHWLLPQSHRKTLCIFFHSMQSQWFDCCCLFLLFISSSRPGELITVIPQSSTLICAPNKATRNVTKGTQSALISLLFTFFLLFQTVLSKYLHFNAALGTSLKAAWSRLWRVWPSQ